MTVPRAPDSELVPVPADGRVFSESVRPGLADCSPSGRIRLDALARWLQDVAYADYWLPLEEELLAGLEPEAIDVEIEHRTPAQPGDKRVLCDGAWRWIVDPAGEVHASMLIGRAGRR